jgi:hypothetical protein
MTQNASLRSSPSLSRIKGELYRQLLKSKKKDTFIDDLWEGPLVVGFAKEVKAALDSQIAAIQDKTFRHAVEQVTKLTQSEIQAVRSVIERDWDSLDGFISASGIQDLLVQVYDISGNHVLDKLGIQANFELKNPGIISQLGDQANLLIKTVDDTTKGQLAKIIADGIQADLSWEEIASQIHTDYPQINSYRSELISRMETANATNQSELDFYRQNGITQKMWVLASSHQDDDECDDNADEGLIPLSQNFPSGDSAPPAHINCACTLNTQLPSDFIENGPNWLGG